MRASRAGRTWRRQTRGTDQLSQWAHQTVRRGKSDRKVSWLITVATILISTDFLPLMRTLAASSPPSTAFYLRPSLQRVQMLCAQRSRTLLRAACCYSRLASWNAICRCPIKPASSCRMMTDGTLRCSRLALQCLPGIRSHDQHGVSCLGSILGLRLGNVTPARDVLSLFTLRIAAALVGRRSHRGSAQLRRGAAAASLWTTGLVRGRRQRSDRTREHPGPAPGQGHSGAPGLGSVRRTVHRHRAHCGSVAHRPTAMAPWRDHRRTHDRACGDHGG
jgi:hypothetical protein